MMIDLLCICTMYTHICCMHGRPLDGEQIVVHEKKEGGPIQYMQSWDAAREWHGMHVLDNIRSPASAGAVS
jgi:hypothetical protein